MLLIHNNDLFIMWKRGYICTADNMIQSESYKSPAQCYWLFENEESDSDWSKCYIYLISL